MCETKLAVFATCFVFFAQCGVCRAETITSASGGISIEDGRESVAGCDVGPGTSTVQCSASHTVVRTGCRIIGPGEDECETVTYSASGAVLASSAFGALSGEITETLAPFFNMFSGYTTLSLDSAFVAEFNNILLITGGTGTGTLVAHFAWQAETSTPGASYRMTFGELFGGFGTQSDCPSGSSPCSGTSDVSTPFTFNQLTPVMEASIAGAIPNHGGFDFSTVTLSASLTLTGFSVYDAAGNLIPGAQVEPTSMPEPGTLWLLFCGILTLLATSHKLRTQPSNRAHANVSAS